MYLNASIPHFKAFVRNEFLYNMEEGHGLLTDCVVFGVSSIANRALGFHIMLDNGACFWRIPLHALCWNKSPIISYNIKLSDCQMWDNISYNISVTEYLFLKEFRCRIKTKDNRLESGTYMFTIDYAESSYAESADEHKCSHIIKLDNGNFAAYPNNRIVWNSESFTTEKEIPKYITNTHIWTCED